MSQALDTVKPDDDQSGLRHAFNYAPANRENEVKRSTGAKKVNRNKTMRVSLHDDMVLFRSLGMADSAEGVGVNDLAPFALCLAWALCLVRD